MGALATASMAGQLDRVKQSAGAMAVAEGSAVAIVAGLLRFDAIQRYGFNSDEAVYSGQAAAIAGLQPYDQLFGVFRAHPLLVHFLVALGYQVTGVNDWLPRLLCAGFGVGLALLCWATARLVQGRLGGLAAGLVAAACPYGVIVSRQVLLDGPAATLVALTAFLLAVWLTRRAPSWLYAAAGAAGLAFLAKETAVLLLPAGLVLLVLTRDLPLRRRIDLPVAALVYAVAVAPYPLSLALGGGGETTKQFLAWQFLRRPNHDAAFYLGVVPALGYVTVALALLGMVAAYQRRHALATFLAAFLVLNLAFFEAWPTKGFQYLLPVLPALAYFAGEAVAALGWLARRAGRTRRTRASWRLAAALAAALALGSLVAGGESAVTAPAAQVATDSDSSDVPLAATGALAGTGGLAAGRPAGQWARAHTLATDEFITVGPSFANVIQFYGGRKARALSVSTNPLRRNPTYEPVPNPDASIRSGTVKYLVYDAYSAARSPFFARKLLSYAKKFSAAPVYEYRQPAASNRHERSGAIVVVIYAVYP